MAAKYRDHVAVKTSNRFEKIVRLYPDRIAIKLGDQTLTYTESTAKRID